MPCYAIAMPYVAPVDIADFTPCRVPPFAIFTPLRRLMGAPVIALLMPCCCRRTARHFFFFFLIFRAAACRADAEFFWLIFGLQRDVAITLHYGSHLLPSDRYC